jgi:hypothetical protein
MSASARGPPASSGPHVVVCTNIRTSIAPAIADLAEVEPRPLATDGIDRPRDASTFPTFLRIPDRFLLSPSEIVVPTWQYRTTSAVARSLLSSTTAMMSHAFSWARAPLLLNAFEVVDLRHTIEHVLSDATAGGRSCRAC